MELAPDLQFKHMTVHDAHLPFEVVARIPGSVSLDEVEICCDIEHHVVNAATPPPEAAAAPAAAPAPRPPPPPTPTRAGWPRSRERTGSRSTSGRPPGPAPTPARAA